MSLLRKIFKRTLPTKLGRWRTDEPMKIVVRKAQLATDDHCGSDLCSKNIKKQKDTKKNEKVSTIVYDMDPLLPYIM